jgi:hypothetical protein
VQVAALHRFVLVEGFPVLPVALAIPLRQERLYRQIGQFLPRVSEHPFHSRVDHADFARRVQHQQAVRRRLHRQHQRLLIGFVGRDVLPQAMKAGKPAVGFAVPRHGDRLIDDCAIRAQSADLHVTVPVVPGAPVSLLSPDMIFRMHGEPPACSGQVRFGTAQHRQIGFVRLLKQSVRIQTGVADLRQLREITEIAINVVHRLVPPTRPSLEWPTTLPADKILAGSVSVKPLSAGQRSNFGNTVTKNG